MFGRDGALSQSIHDIAAKGKDVAAQDDALQALAASQQGDLEEIAVTMG